METKNEKQETHELPPGWSISDTDGAKGPDISAKIWAHWERVSGLTRAEYEVLLACKELCEGFLRDAHLIRADKLPCHCYQCRARAALTPSTAEGVNDG